MLRTVARDSIQSPRLPRPSVRRFRSAHLSSCLIRPLQFRMRPATPSFASDKFSSPLVSTFRLKYEITLRGGLAKAHPFFVMALRRFLVEKLGYHGYSD